MYKIWRRALPFIFIFTFFHFLKDVAQDVLHIETPLLLLFGVKEDLSEFPDLLQNLFVGLGYSSYIAEIFLLVLIPVIMKRHKNSLLERIVILVVILLIIYFLSAILLDPRIQDLLSSF